MVKRSQKGPGHVPLPGKKAKVEKNAKKTSEELPASSVVKTKMEEHLALVSSEQKVFKKVSLKRKANLSKITKSARRAIAKQMIESNRGAIHLHHIPHGFFEEEIKQYFSQFGHVTNVCLARSFKTGASLGHAYVEFAIDDVAKIVAETMHDYIMFNRILKCDHIPNGKINDRVFRFKYIRPENCPKVLRRMKEYKNLTKQNNKVEKKTISRQSRRLNLKLKSLKEKGVHIEPFIQTDKI